jgi:hypothetical protein
MIIRLIVEFIERESIKVGDFCSAKFSEDDIWYRAVVIGTMPKQGDQALEASRSKAKEKLEIDLDRPTHIEVFYLDFGNSEVISFSGDRVREIPTCLELLPPIVFPCSIHGIKPFAGANWSQLASNSFRDLCEKDVSLVQYVRSSKCGMHADIDVKYEVKLGKMDCPDWVAMEMVKRGQAMKL